MSSSRRFRVLQRAGPTLLTRGRAPLVVSWIVTNRCNLRCVYCGCPDNVRDELSTKEALDAIDEMAALGTAAAHLTGGEPLVRKDLSTLIQRLRFHDIRVSLSSNGTLIPKKLRTIRDVAEVSLSLDGPPAIHDKNRAEGQVAEVEAALQALQDVHIRRKLQCLVTKTTTEECLDFVLERGRRYGAPVYFQPALDIVLATTDPNPVVAGQDHVRRILKAVDARRARGAPVGNTAPGLAHLSRYPTPGRLVCPINRAIVRLDPTGHLLPCHERNDLPTGEDIRDGGFGAAFARLKLVGCTECWGAGRVELRESLKTGPGALLKLARKHQRPPS